LITRIKLRAKKGEGAATLDELAEFARGLICLTRHPEARLLDIFGRSNVYAELQRHHRREEKRPTRPSSNARGVCASRWSPPTAPPTPRQPSASCWMCSPASAIM